MGIVEKRGGKTATMWVSELEASQRAWAERDEDRDILREMVGKNLSFPPLVFGGDGSTDGASGIGLNPHIDQIDINLPLRYVNKVRSLVGDEEPEVRFTRDYEGWNMMAQELDTLVMTLMGEAGAPDEMSDCAAQTCTDGLSTLWVLPNVPMMTRDELHRMGEPIQKRIMDGVQGVEEPSRVDDHLEVAKELQGVALDPKMPEMDPSGEKTDNLIDASTAHLEAREAEEKAYTNWRVTEPGLEIRRLPYGSHALMDPSATALRYARWVADLIVMPEEEASHSTYLRPVFRKNMRPESRFDRGDNTGDPYSSSATSSKRGIDLDPVIKVWRIWDFERREVYLVNKGCQYFGERDSSYPFVDRAGKPLIKPLGPHPGFFPCWMEPAMKPVVDDHQKALGVAPLLVGLKIALAITKDYSHYHQSLKRAAATQYVFHSQCDEGFMAVITSGLDGKCTKAPSNLDDINHAIVPIRKETPPVELFGMISNLIDTWCIVQSFPKLELTTVPNKDSTATQDKMAQAGGDLFMREILRKFEVGYAWMALQVARFSVYLPMSKWMEILPEEKATLLRGMVEKIGIPNVLPKTRFASGERDRDPIRIKQALDFHERVKTEVMPGIGLPIYDTAPILNESGKALGFGPLIKKEYSDAQIQAILMTQEDQGGQKRQPGEKAPSSEQKRDRPRTRGGRRGRASNSAPHGKAEGSANDTGPK